MLQFRSIFHFGQKFLFFSGSVSSIYTSTFDVALSIIERPLALLFLRTHFGTKYRKMNDL